ncbi:MAG: MFS transporter, partial [Candidatus Lokiarchaeota archaeon]|nr:MFS transporter [Candidatus Lokiarchaeota archaeon]
MKPSNNDVNQARPEEESLLKMVMFSTGYFLNTFLMIAFNNYVWTFYEGELGLISIVPLWSIYMAIANTLYTIGSMLINPVIGYLTDKPFKWTKKRGFHTPWIIIGGIPTIILFFFLFTPPQVSGIESVLPILIYYIIFVFLYDMSYSLLQTHSFGAFAAHFRGDKSRRKGGMLTQIFTFIANFLAITIWSQIIDPGNPGSFTIAAFISVIILICSFLVFIPGSKEDTVIKERFSVGHDNSERTSFFKTMKMCIRQKNFMLAVISYLTFMISFGLMSMNTVNFVDDVLQEKQYIRSLGSILMLLSSFVTMPIWARLAKRIGHSNTYAIGLASYGITLLLNLFIVNAFQFYIISVLNGVSGSLFMIMLSPIFADCYDEIAVKTKKHQQTTLIGIRNFFVRTSVMVQSFIIAIIHALTFYNPIDVSHQDNALIGLRIIQGLIPFIVCILGALIFYKWYDLKGLKKQE